MRGYILSEIEKAWIWYKRIASIFAQWIFQIFIRLLFGCAILYLLGGGCFLRSYRNSKAESAKHASTLSQQGTETRSGPEQTASAPVYRERNENLQNQIRTGQSQVRSWDYTVRSIKNDIERWFKKG